MILIALTDDEFDLVKRSLGHYEKRQRSRMRQSAEHERTNMLASIEQRIQVLGKLREHLDKRPCTYDRRKE